MITPTSRFDTAQIGPMRKFVAQIPALQASIGNIAQLRLIVDANFVVGELIYRVRHPHRGATALEELVKSTVIEAFAPRWLDTEMTTSTIPKAAKRSKVSEFELRARWAEFRMLLKWDDSLREPGTTSNTCCDPKDLPYIRLQQKVNADGILSKDAHIARMGGHPLTLDFVLTARGYARSAVTTMSIRVMGVVLPCAALMTVAEAVRSLARVFVRFPEPIKAMIILGGTIAVLHPGGRKWISERCADACLVIAPAWQAVLQLASDLSATSAAAEAQALHQLHEINKAIRPRRSTLASVPAKRRRRARVGAPVVPALATNH
jgi:predicted nucleic acid-binding protein